MYGKILVPIDGSEASACGLNEAIKLARKCGSRILLLHIVNELIFAGGYGAGTYAGDLIGSLRDAGKSLLAQGAAQAWRQGVESEAVIVESMGTPAADFIVQQARRWSADLIVMGTHGRRGLIRVAMGSDAESVMRIAPVPVLLVRNTLQRRRKLMEPAGAAA
jgi:nucleotide-binding universal stress UspA family protein